MKTILGLSSAVVAVILGGCEGSSSGGLDTDRANGTQAADGGGADGSAPTEVHDSGTGVDVPATSDPREAGLGESPGEGSGRAEPEVDIEDGNETASSGCSGPDSPDGAYQCRHALVGCPCSEESAYECVRDAERRWVAFACYDGSWTPMPNSRCEPDSPECFSPTQNVELAQSGQLRGCACDDRNGEDTIETCARVDELRVPMWCLNGAWQADPHEFGCSVASDLCSVGPLDSTCPQTLSGVSQTVFPDVLLDGQPGCEFDCGYRYSEYWEPGDDAAWIHDPQIACPLDQSECEQMTAALLEAPLVCAADDDCTWIDGHTNCNDVFEPPLYIDSALLSSDERAERAALWARILAAGCGDRTGFDGPIWEVGCIDGRCGLRQAGECGAAPPEQELDAGVREP